MTRPRVYAYLQLTLPFFFAILCAAWIVLRQQPVPDLQGVLPLLLLVTSFTTLISVNLDRPWPRTALTGLNLAALLFFYLTTVHPARLLALL